MMNRKPANAEVPYSPFEPFIPPEIDFDHLLTDPRRFVTAPWCVGVKRWSASVPVETVEEELQQQYESFSTDDERVRWSGKRRVFGLSNRVTLSTNGEILVSRYLPGWVRAFYTLALLAAPVLIWYAPFSAASLYFLLSIGVPEVSSRPPGPNMVLAGQKTSGIAGLCMILAMIAVLLKLNTDLDFAVVEGALLLGVATQVTIMYLENGLPRIDTEVSDIALFIPLFGILLTLVSLAFFFVVVWLFGADYLLAEAWDGFFVRSFNRAKAGILADMVGGIPSYAPGMQITERQVKLLFLRGLVDFIPYVILLSGVLYLIATWTAWRLELMLSRARLTGFGPYGREAVLLGTVAANLFILGTFTIAISIISYGVTGTSLLSTSTFAPIANFYTAGDSPGGEAFLRGIYGAFDIIFSGSDWLPARFGTLVFFFVLLWPILLIGVSSLNEIIVRPIRTFWILSRSRPLTDACVEISMPNDIHVRVVDLDGQLDARPVFFFGIRKYIVVSEAVVQEFRDSPRQLEAILRHEEYHLDNRDHPFLATVLALGVGGRNAALAFYDYPRIEREADKYAKEATDFDSISTAIRRMYGKRAEQDWARTDIPFSQPSFAGGDIGRLQQELRERVRRTVDDDLVELYVGVRSALRWADVVSGALRRVLFGPVLVGSAHLEPDERISRLTE